MGLSAPCVKATTLTGTAPESPELVIPCSPCQIVETARALGKAATRSALGADAMSRADGARPRWVTRPIVNFGFGNADFGIPKLKIIPPRAHGNLDLEKIGANVTLGVLRMITAPARDNSNGELAQWARPIRERLGPKTVEQIRAYLNELSANSLSDLTRHGVGRHRK